MTEEELAIRLDKIVRTPDTWSFCPGPQFREPKSSRWRDFKNKMRFRWIMLGLWVGRLANLPPKIYWLIRSELGRQWTK